MLPTLPAEPATLPPEQSMSPGSVNKAATGAGKTRLLVIDDDNKLCRLINDYLEPMGYDVETAHTGPDGLEKAQAGQ